MISESEIADFRHVIENKGYDPDDFELEEIRDSLDGSKMYAITGVVTIRRKSNGIERTYKAGHGTSWPEQFDADVKNNAFE